MSDEIATCEWDGAAFCLDCHPPCEHLLLCPACREDAGCIECARDARDVDLVTETREDGMA